MITARQVRLGLAVTLVVALLTGVAAITRSSWHKMSRTHLVAYFDNSNGIFVGDEVRILGVPVGAIDKIEPQPERAKITFWVDKRYSVPAAAKAVILSPQLVTARAIAITPAYTGGAVMADGDVIPLGRTAVPVEWDDLRQQLQKLTESLQPTQPGGVSTLGAFINTAANNLRGEGPNIRDTLVKLAQAFSMLGDHSADIFSTVKNLSVLVSALQTSSDLMAELNRNLAAVSAPLAENPTEVGQAVEDLNTAVGDVRTFVADNRETLGTTTDKLSAVSTTIVDSLNDIKQLLHLAPNALQNLSNTYQPAQAALSGALSMNNFANPIEFLCGAIQAASRLGADQSAKLCVQYLAPIIKNRQYNFLPFGENLVVGAAARPNEITYSENWMRPDHVPLPAATPSPDVLPPPTALTPPVGELPAQTNPSDGLPGMMMPAGAGR